MKHETLDFLLALKVHIYLIDLILLILEDQVVLFDDKAPHETLFLSL